MLKYMPMIRLATLTAFIASIYLLSYILMRKFMISFSESMSLTISAFMLASSICTVCIEHLDGIIYIIAATVLATIFLRTVYRSKNVVLRADSGRAYIARVRSELLSLATFMLISFTYLLAQLKYGYYPSDEWIAVGIAKAVLKGSLEEYVNATRYFTLYGFLLAGLSNNIRVSIITIDLTIAITIVLPLLYLSYLSVYRYVLKRSSAYVQVAVTLILVSGGLIGIFNLGGRLHSYADYIRFSNILSDGYRGDYFLTTGIWTLKTLGIALALSAALAAQRITVMLQSRRCAHAIAYIVFAALVLHAAARTYLPSIAYFVFTYPILAAMNELSLRAHLLTISFLSAAYMLMDMLVSNSAWKIFLATKTALVQAPKIIVVPTYMPSIILGVTVCILTVLLTVFIAYMARLVSKSSGTVVTAILAMVAALCTLVMFCPITQSLATITIMHNYAIAVVRYLPLLLAAVVLSATQHNRQASIALAVYLVYTLIIAAIPIPEVVKPRLYMILKFLLVLSIIILLQVNRSTLARIIAVSLLMLSILSFTTFTDYSIMLGIGQSKTRDAVSLASKLDMLAKNADRAVVCINDWIAKHMALWLLGITPAEDCAGLLRLKEPTLLITSKQVGQILDNEPTVCGNIYCALLLSPRKAAANSQVIILRNIPKHIKLNVALKDIGVCVSTLRNSNDRGKLLILLGSSFYISVLRSSQNSQCINIYDGSKVKSIPSAIPYRDRILTIAVIHGNNIIVLAKDELSLITVGKNIAGAGVAEVLFKTTPERVKWKPYNGEAYAVIIICKDCTALDKLLTLAELCQAHLQSG